MSRPSQIYIPYSTTDSVNKDEQGKICFCRDFICTVADPGFSKWGANPSRGEARSTTVVLFYSDQLTFTFFLPQKRFFSESRIHSSRMHTARSSSRPGGLHQQPPGAEAPRRKDPPPVNRITDTCENITLPQLRCGR